MLQVNDDIEVQTAVPNPKEVETYTLWSEERDAAVKTSSEEDRAVGSASAEMQGAAASEAKKPPKSFLVLALTPDGNYRRAEVQMDADSPCSALLPSAAPQFPQFRMSEAAKIFSREATYTRGAQRRRATRCFDQEAKKYLYIDSEDGAPVDRSSIECVARRFLRPTSALPSSPRPSPAITVLCDSEIFVGSPSGGLEPASDDALTDPGVLVMLRGVRREEQFFWQLCGGSFVSGSSGEQFASREEIPEGRKSYIFVLLREGDSVPRVKVPDGEYLFAMQRTGSRAKVEKGRVRVGSAEWSPRDIELWDSSRIVEDFEEK